MCWFPPAVRREMTEQKWTLHAGGPAAEATQESSVWPQVAAQVGVYPEFSESWSLQTCSLDALRKILTSTQEIISLISFFIGGLYLPTW